LLSARGQHKNLNANPNTKVQHKNFGYTFHKGVNFGYTFHKGVNFGYTFPKGINFGYTFPKGINFGYTFPKGVRYNFFSLQLKIKPQKQKMKAIILWI